MYYNCLNDVRRDLDSEIYTLRKLEKRLSGMNYLEGSLVTKRNSSNGRTEYYHQYTEAGRIVQRYINREHQWIIEHFRERRAIELAIKRCQVNIAQMQSLLKAYRSLSPDEIDRALSIVYQGSERYRLMLQDQVGAQKWLKEKQREKESLSSYIRKYDDRPECIACDGTVTSSRVEAMHIDAFYSLAIPHIYELPIKLVKKEPPDIWNPEPYERIVIRIPDFTCLNKRTGQEFLVEHIGMTHDENYMDKNDMKLKLYIDNGFIPYKNLLLTYEDSNGSIDMPPIIRLFETYLT